MFESRLPKDKYMLLYLSDSKLTPRWLYAGLLDQMGLESHFYRGDSKRQLQKEIENVRNVTAFTANIPPNNSMSYDSLL